MNVFKLLYKIINKNYKFGINFEMYFVCDNLKRPTTVDLLFLTKFK